jgi:hypothetical protein
MCIVSWNCRGLGNPSKAEAVKDLLKIDPPEILLLQETKIEGDTLLEINNQKWKKNVGKAISARGLLRWPCNLVGEGQVSFRNFFRDPTLDFH